MSQQEFLETVMKEREYLDMKASAAFVRAQAGFGAALKTSTNPHFRSRYADLSACVEAVIDSLHKNGFALMQKTHECENGVAIETIFIHESGEQISGGIFRVPAGKQDPQGYASALTYARRNSLMAASGIAPEDDDGNAASRRKPLPDITDHLSAIDASANSEELAVVFKAAIEACGEHQELQAKVIAAKKTRVERAKKEKANG